MRTPEPVVIDGVLWKPYSVNHIDADGKKFSFYIFAISREHAACVVDDIRETAWLGDEIVGWSMFHELKILPEHFAPVMAGIKLAELRLNDRDFREDDTLCLREYENGEYTGRIVYRRVIHVADVGAYLPGYVLLSMED